MQLHEATIEDISQELATRDKPQTIIFYTSDRPGFPMRVANQLIAKTMEDTNRWKILTTIIDTLDRQQPMSPRDKEYWD
jgi:hypothetical protein